MASAEISSNDTLSEHLRREGENMLKAVREAMVGRSLEAVENLEWLKANMPPYFFITMKEEVEAMLNLINSLRLVPRQRKLNLLEEPRKLIIARRDLPGSLYDTLKNLREHAISYAEMTHSTAPIPNDEKELEVQKFEFDLKTPAEIAAAGPPKLPRGIIKPVAAAMRRMYPDFDFSELKEALWTLQLNSPHYIRVSPPERIARLLWLYQQCRHHDGLFLDVEKLSSGPEQARLVFAVGNPPQSGFLTQVMEVFARLGIGVRRFYALNLSTPYHSYFLGNFYVVTYDKKPIDKGSLRFGKLKSELYNTQILSSDSEAYRELLTEHILSGEETTLTNAFIGFVHTTLAHNQPDRFDREEVKTAFISQPGMTRMLINLFKTRFEPGVQDREGLYQKVLEDTRQAIDSFNTGHRRLDQLRRTIYRTCLIFIKYTLKTNFFVPEKHALAFRLDPAYLLELGEEFTSDLPQATPFRVTFFFGRHGLGYHIGFSDIARGGWRTIICRSQDEYTTNSNTLFREVFVLAHTQHLKNKDIYEGGSKLTVVLNAVNLPDPEAEIQRLYKLQYGFINAFFDLFVTENGKAKSPYVVDYYGDDEPIEIGPDENMHDAMIELIARLSVRRGYVLGIGVISSKSIGINHKEYGVTSRGVIRFATVAMRQVGIDIEKDPFSVKMTGGPFGDVAGNCMKLLLERCPKVAIKSIIDGSGALFDPQGADHQELARHLLADDIVAFDPKALHPGGFMLYRHERKTENLRDLYKKVVRTPQGLEEQWITTDEIQKEFDELLFGVETDLFLPCGGRPETIDKANWRQFFGPGGSPSSRVIVEGANSFITPEARHEIQRRGVILLRDASANKCGVISSSYEIIANLLMSQKEFLNHKEEYVKDVLDILDKRAGDEANLIFRRFREHEGRKLYTDISIELSNEINEHYARLFTFFQQRPELADRPLFRKVILSHLPAILRNTPKFRARVKDLPPKIKFAILASEIASFIVYRGDWDSDLEGRLTSYLKAHFK